MSNTASSILIPFVESFERQAIASSPDCRSSLGEDSLVISHTAPLVASPTYEIAFLDQDYVLSDHARAMRIQMEMDKPEWHMQQAGIRSTIIVFGSARFISSNKAHRLLEEANEKLTANPNCKEAKAAVAKAECQMKTSVYYDQARKFAQIVARDTMKDYPPNYEGPFDYVICTGGGPGIMEAGNRGAYDVGAPSIGLNIKLPYEQHPNPYTSPHLCFQFHYFNVRKLHFMLRAKALVCSPGGYGTFDELFEGLTLRQTERMQKIPIVLLGVEFWNKCVNFEYLAEVGVICPEDLKLFHLTDSPQEAWDVIKAFYR